MVFDIAAGILVLAFGYMGSRSGAFAQLYQLGILVGAAVLAKLAAAPTSRFIIQAVEWSPSFAHGLCFLVYLGIFTAVAYFFLGSILDMARDRADGHGIDMAVAGLLGVVRGALVVYVLLAGAMLVTQRMGAQKAGLAFQYQKSRVGALVLTRNVVDSQPFPHAIALKHLAGNPQPGFTSSYPHALALVGKKPAGRFLVEDPQVRAAIAAGQWKTLRKDPRMLALLTDHEFLAAADKFMTPNLDVEAENPEDRFKELK